MGSIDDQLPVAGLGLIQVFLMRIFFFKLNKSSWPVIKKIYIYI